MQFQQPEATESIVIAKGNCGIPSYQEGQIHYHGTPELMAEYAVLARDLGVKIIGGCCGTSLEHLRAMRAALDTTQKGPKPSEEMIADRLGVAWKQISSSTDPADQAGRQRRRRRSGRTPSSS